MDLGFQWWITNRVPNLDSGLGVKKNGAERKLMGNGDRERDEINFCIFSGHCDIFVLKTSANSN